MINEQAKKLGEALVASKVMTPAQLDEAVKAASKDNAPSLIVGLLETGFLTFKVFEKFVSASMGIQSAIVASKPPIKPIVDLLGRDTLFAHLIYPFGLREDKGVKSLALGMVDPLDKEIVQIVETKTGCRVIPVLISLPDFKDGMNRYFPPQVEVKSEKEDFVLVRPGGDEEQMKANESQQTGQETGTYHGTKTVQPKPGWDHSSLNVQGSKGRLSADLMGQNKKKFREEVLAILDLDPIDAKFLKEESYTREILLTQLKNVSPVKLQKIYNTLSAEIKIEALVNTLIKAEILGKNDMLIWAAVSAVFHEETK